MSTSSDTYEESVNKNEVVLFCDEQGNLTGEFGPKLDSHHAHTRMHSAFSAYVFNKKGQFLVTKRALTKRIWPGIWTNSCCGHPGRDESREDAIRRRVDFELGMKIDDVRLIVPNYTYKTPPYRGIIEHEYCPVYVAQVDVDPVPNPNEVAEYKWVDWEWYVAQAESDSDDYENLDAPGAPQWSWWCKDQLKTLHKSDAFKEFLSTLTSS